MINKTSKITDIPLQVYLPKNRFPDVDDQQLFPSDKQNSSEGYNSNQQQNDQEQISQQLLKKISQLHSAINQVQMLQFQLLQCQIMKSQDLIKNQKLQKDIAEVQNKILQAKQTSYNLQFDIETCSSAIERVKKQNNKYYIQKEQIVRNIGRLDKNIESMRKSMKIDVKVKEGQEFYIQLEKMKLQMKSQQRQDQLASLKEQITRTKAQLHKKQAQNEALQKQQQQLLALIKKAKTKNSIQPNNKNKYQSSSKHQANTLRQFEKKQIHFAEEYQIGKQNDLQSVNAITLSNESGVSKPNKDLRMQSSRNRRQGTTLKKNKVF